MKLVMRPALRTSPSRPKPKDSGREKTSLSGRLAANFVVFEAPDGNVAQSCESAKSPGNSTSVASPDLAVKFWVFDFL